MIEENEVNMRRRQVADFDSGSPAARRCTSKRLKVAESKHTPNFNRRLTLHDFYRVKCKQRLDLFNVGDRAELWMFHTFTSLFSEKKEKKIK